MLIPNDERDEGQNEYARNFVQDAYGHAVRLRLPESAAAAGGKGSFMQRLIGCLNAIPEFPADKEVFTLAEAAKYLRYSDSGFWKVVNRNEIKHSQKGQGKITFHRAWLDGHQQAKQGVERSQPQKRSKALPIKSAHGFDVSLLQAESQSGSG